MKKEKPARKYTYKRLGGKTIATIARLLPHQNKMVKEMAESRRVPGAEIIRSSIESSYKRHGKLRSK